MMNFIEKYDRQFAYSGVIMNIALAVQAYMLWIHPTINDADKIYTIAILMAFEFFMIHSGVFMAAFPKKVSLYIFFPLYGLFALAINTMADGNAVLYLYLIVVFQRMRFAFSDVNKGLKNRAVAFSTYAVFIWMFTLGIIMFNKNNLPLNALTEDFLTLSGYRNKHSIGAFTDNPHIAMAFGIIYYLLLALTEFNLTRAFIKHPERFEKML
jgi:hypothetical protein